MARSDPEKLAQALRANLRRRKPPTPARPSDKAAPASQKAPESVPEKPRPPKS